MWKEKKINNMFETNKFELFPIDFQIEYQICETIPSQSMPGFQFKLNLDYLNNRIRTKWKTTKKWNWERKGNWRHYLALYLLTVPWNSFLLGLFKFRLNKQILWLMGLLQKRWLSIPWTLKGKVWLSILCFWKAVIVYR